MKLPYSMLLDFVDTQLNPDEVGQLLTMIGFELEDVLSLEGEPVLHLNATANRGDVTNAFGFAREVLAKDPKAKPTELFRSMNLNAFECHTTESCVGLQMKSDKCSRYSYQIYCDVQNGSSPEWLQKRLLQASIRPISLIVDLTNYVMLELGQPMHAFDLDTLSGPEIIVREANAGETLATLNGVENQLQSHHLLICDAKKPIALAGIMGGAETEITESTRNILLESAHFNPNSVRATRTQLGISTESSYRFERWVDPEGTLRALKRFQELYEKITGKACAVPTGESDHYPKPYKCPNISVRVTRAQKIFGINIASGDAKGYLEALGFQVQGNGEPFQVQNPSWRPDVTQEIDLVEEIGRIHGYDLIPQTPPQGTTTQGGVFGFYQKADQTANLMIQNGFAQVISHTLGKYHPLDHPRGLSISVRNPHSPEASLLRSSVLSGLSDVALRNGGKNIALFEVGKAFYKLDDQIVERTQLGLWSQGSFNEFDWQTKNQREIDFYTLKGVVENLALHLRITVDFHVPKSIDGRFHPTRCAELRVDAKKIGIAGQIHPDVAENIGIPENTYLAEIDLIDLFSNKQDSVTTKPISKNPAIRRDIAILVEKSISYDQIDHVIRRECGEVLEKVWLFDVFAGKGMSDTQHSLAIGMLLRKPGQNLTDEEANKIRDQIVSKLEQLGAKLR
jgi:phenylalanyl-tRNA synthetase beta chain